MVHWRHTFIVIFIFLFIFEILGSKPVSFLVPPKKKIQNRNTGRHKLEMRNVTLPKTKTQNKWDQDFESRYQLVPNILRRQKTPGNQATDMIGSDRQDTTTAAPPTPTAAPTTAPSTPLWRTYLVPANFADLVAVFQLVLDVNLFWGGETGLSAEWAAGIPSGIASTAEKAPKQFRQKNPWIKFLTRYKSSKLLKFVNG